MIPFVDDPDFTLYVGDVREVLAELPDGSVNCCVTSPPYWGLRDYGSDGQIGLEDSPDAFVAVMVEVFREMRRVLADDGTLWLNLGDSYQSAKGAAGQETPDPKQPARRFGLRPNDVRIEGLKQKDLVGIPWLVAFALRADGWYLRSDIIWAKPNPMPESVTDRPTKSHEYVFLLSKSPRYFFDQEAVREPAEWARWGDQTVPKHEGTNTKTGWMQPKTKAELQRKASVHRSSIPGGRSLEQQPSGGRNIRTVWEIATQPYAEAHFATFPEELPRRCIAAGCPEWVCATCGKPRERILERTAMVINRSERTHDLGQTRSSGTMREPATAATIGWSDCGHDDYRPGVVLDPFMGSGTTALVARKLNRRSIGIELSPEYAALCARRLQQLSLLA